MKSYRFNNFSIALILLILSFILFILFNNTSFSKNDYFTDINRINMSKKIKEKIDKASTKNITNKTSATATATASGSPRYIQT
jgi:hypothetical protein